MGKINPDWFSLVTQNYSNKLPAWFWLDIWLLFLAVAVEFIWTGSCSRFGASNSNRLHLNVSQLHLLQNRFGCAFGIIVLWEHPTFSNFQPSSCSFAIKKKKKSGGIPPSSVSHQMLESTIQFHSVKLLFVPKGQFKHRHVKNRHRIVTMPPPPCLAADKAFSCGKTSGSSLRVNFMS